LERKKSGIKAQMRKGKRRSGKILTRKECCDIVPPNRRTQKRKKEVALFSRKKSKRVHPKSHAAARRTKQKEGIKLLLTRFVAERKDDPGGEC